MANNVILTFLTLTFDLFRLKKFSADIYGNLVRRFNLVKIGDGLWPVKLSQPDKTN